MNSPPNATAIRLRRRRRSASRHGPESGRVFACRASPSKAAGPSSANSVAGSVAMRLQANARGRAAVGPPAHDMAYFLQNSSQSFL